MNSPNDFSSGGRLYCSHCNTRKHLANVNGDFAHTSTWHKTGTFLISEKAEDSKE